jgi:hypothetical protein
MREAVYQKPPDLPSPSVGKKTTKLLVYSLVQHFLTIFLSCGKLFGIIQFISAIPEFWKINKGKPHLQIFTSEGFDRIKRGITNF